MLGQLIGIDLRLPPVVAGTLALALNIGAYGAEVVRGAIQAVPGSQHEAAQALDFTPRQTLWRISLPQAIPEMMPSFGNLAVQNLKGTATASRASWRDEHPSPSADSDTASFPLRSIAFSPRLGTG